MNRVGIFASFAIAGMSATIAFAQNADPASATPDKKPEKAPRPTFQQLDADADGKLSPAEIAAKIPSFNEDRFKTRDKDGDGFLSPQEMAGSQRDKIAKPMSDAAQGQEKTRKPAELFFRADADKSGSVSLEEVNALEPNFTKERFDKLDKDKDGLLTAKEFPQQRPDQNFTSKPAEQSGLFMRVDENKDGKITFDELALKAPKYTREQFDRMDANKDGAISRQEMVAYGAGQKKDPNQMTASAKPDATASALNSPQQLMRKADANKDAVVSFEEMKAVAPNMTRERFDAMDKNKDGNLSAADRGGADSDNKSAMAENMQKLMESDSDKDGTLTFEELAAAKPGFPREAFDRADKNKDGKITDADI